MRDGPWKTADVAIVMVGEAMGLAVIAAAWVRTSGQPTPARQVPWIASAMAGVILAGIGNAAWLARAHRAIGKRRVGALLRPTEVLLHARRVTPAPDALVTVPGARRYHRASCPLVSNKTVVPVVPGDGGPPCGVCAP
jgi:hypothetical protein